MMQQPHTTEIVFTVHRDRGGGYWAEAAGHSIRTQGKDLDELAVMIEDAAACHFDDWDANPRSIVWRFAAADVPA